MALRLSRLIPGDGRPLPLNYACVVCGCGRRRECGREQMPRSHTDQYVNTSAIMAGGLGWSSFSSQGKVAEKKTISTVQKKTHPGDPEWECGGKEQLGGRAVFPARYFPTQVCCSGSRASVAPCSHFVLAF